MAIPVYFHLQFSTLASVGSNANLDSLSLGNRLSLGIPDSLHNTHQAAFWLRVTEILEAWIRFREESDPVIIVTFFGVEE
jgi:hypothetical protein